MAEIEEGTPKSQKDLFRERLAAKYPEKDFSDEEELYRTSMEGYDKDHENLKGISKANQAMGERLSADPKAGAALAEFMGGKPLPVALRKYFSDDELSMGEDDPGYSEYIEAIKTREAAAQASKQAMAEYESNLEASRAEGEAFAQEKGMSPEEFDTFIETAIDKIVSPLLKGMLSKEMLDILFKGLNYENDLASAQEMGRIAGKNEKIQETRRVKKADGLPGIGAGGSVTPPSEAKPNTPFGFVDKNAETDIWKRGGLK